MTAPDPAVPLAELLALAIERSPAIVAVVDPQLCYVAASPRWRRFFGLEPGLLLGRPHPGARLASWDERLRRCLDGEDQLVEADRFEAPGGTVSYVDWEASRCLGSSGEVLGVSVAIRAKPSDVWAERVSEPPSAERCARASRPLGIEDPFLHSQKLESLGVLAGGIAHDFNNLLMGVLGSASLATRQLHEQKPAWAQLAQVERTARRASELCQQLLAYAGKGQADVQPLDLSALVQETAHLLEVSRSKNARLVFECAADLPAVRADVAQLRQVVMNLIINASDAIGDASGTIRIGTRARRCDASLDEGLPEGIYVALTVTDDGAGMDEATRLRIFDPFFSTKRQGHGLGMAAVLGIVRRHGGMVRVVSAPGEGTTVSVLLPATDARPLPVAVPVEDAAGWTHRGTALLVDDEPVVREVVRDMLSEIGLSAVTASEGEDAIALLEGLPSRFDLVVLDLHMPGMPSLEVLGALRAAIPSIPVLLTSGYGPSDPVRGALKEHAGTAFLQKPYRLADLQVALRSLLGGQRSA